MDLSLPLLHHLRSLHSQLINAESTSFSTTTTTSVSRLLDRLPLAKLRGTTERIDLMDWVNGNQIEVVNLAGEREGVLGSGGDGTSADQATNSLSSRKTPKPIVGEWGKLRTLLSRIYNLPIGYDSDSKISVDSLTGRIVASAKRGDSGLRLEIRCLVRMVEKGRELEGFSSRPEPTGASAADGKMKTEEEVKMENQTHDGRGENWKEGDTSSHGANRREEEGWALKDLTTLVKWVEAYQEVVEKVCRASNKPERGASANHQVKSESVSGQHCPPRQDSAPTQERHHHQTPSSNLDSTAGGSRNPFPPQPDGPPSSPWNPFLEKTNETGSKRVSSIKTGHIVKDRSQAAEGAGQGGPRTRVSGQGLENTAGVNSRPQESVTSKVVATSSSQMPVPKPPLFLPEVPTNPPSHGALPTDLHAPHQESKVRIVPTLCLRGQHDTSLIDSTQPSQTVASSPRLTEPEKDKDPTMKPNSGEDGISGRNPAEGPQGREVRTRPASSKNLRIDDVNSKDKRSSPSRPRSPQAESTTVPDPQTTHSIPTNPQPQSEPRPLPHTTNRRAPRSQRETPVASTSRRQLTPEPSRILWDLPACEPGIPLSRGSLPSLEKFSTWEWDTIPTHNNSNPSWPAWMNPAARERLVFDAPEGFDSGFALTPDHLQVSNESSNMNVDGDGSNLVYLCIGKERNYFPQSQGGRILLLEPHFLELSYPHQKDFNVLLHIGPGQFEYCGIYRVVECAERAAYMDLDVDRKVGWLKYFGMEVLREGAELTPEVMQKKREGLNETMESFWMRATDPNEKINQIIPIPEQPPTKPKTVKDFHRQLRQGKIKFPYVVLALVGFDRPFVKVLQETGNAFEVDGSEVGTLQTDLIERHSPSPAHFEEASRHTSKKRLAKTRNDSDDHESFKKRKRRHVTEENTGEHPKQDNKDSREESNDDDRHHIVPKPPLAPTASQRQNLKKWNENSRRTGSASASPQKSITHSQSQLRQSNPRSRSHSPTELSFAPNPSSASLFRNRSPTPVPRLVTDDGDGDEGTRWQEGVRKTNRRIMAIDYREREPSPNHYDEFAPEKSPSSVVGLQRGDKGDHGSLGEPE